MTTDTGDPGDPSADRNNGQITGERDSKGRFRHGNKGRRPGSRNRLQKAIQRQMAKELPYVIENLIEKAKGGHVAAAIALLRTFVPQAREEAQPIMLDLPAIETATDASAAMAEVISAVARGEIGPDAGERLTGMLSAHVKAIETASLETRLTRLEAALDRVNNTKTEG